MSVAAVTRPRPSPRTRPRTDDRDVDMAKQHGARELAEYIGATALVRIPPMHTGRPREDEEMWVPVRVADVRAMFGRLDLLVEPVGGRGQQWVSADRAEGLKLNKPGAASETKRKSAEPEPEPEKPAPSPKRRPKGRH